MYTNCRITYRRITCKPTYIIVELFGPIRLHKNRSVMLGIVSCSSTCLKEGLPSALNTRGRPVRLMSQYWRFLWKQVVDLTSLSIALSVSTSWNEMVGRQTSQEMREGDEGRGEGGREKGEREKGGRKGEGKGRRKEREVDRLDLERGRGSSQVWRWGAYPV